MIFRGTLMIKLREIICLTSLLSVELQLSHLLCLSLDYYQSWFLFFCISDSSHI